MSCSLTLSSPPYAWDPVPTFIPILFFAWLWVLLNPLNLTYFRYSIYFCFVDLTKGFPAPGLISFISWSSCSFIYLSFWFFCTWAGSLLVKSANWLLLIIDDIKAFVMFSWLKLGPEFFLPPSSIGSPVPANSSRNFRTSLFLLMILFLWNFALRFSHRSAYSLRRNWLWVFAFEAPITWFLPVLSDWAQIFFRISYLIWSYCALPVDSALLDESGACILAPRILRKY